MLFTVRYQTAVKGVWWVRSEILPFAPNRKMEFLIDGELRTPKSIAWVERKQLFEVWVEPQSVADLTARGWSVWQPDSKSESNYTCVETQEIPDQPRDARRSIFDVKYFLVNNGVLFERSGTLNFAPTSGIKFVLDGDERASTRVAWINAHQTFEVTFRRAKERVDWLLDRGWNKTAVENEEPDSEQSALSESTEPDCVSDEEASQEPDLN